MRSSFIVIHHPVMMFYEIF